MSTIGSDGMYPKWKFVFYMINKFYARFFGYVSNIFLKFLFW